MSVDVERRLEDATERFVDTLGVIVRTDTLEVTITEGDGGLVLDARALVDGTDVALKTSPDAHRTVLAARPL